MDRFEVLRKEYRVIVLIGMPLVSSLFIYWLLIQFIIPPPQASQRAGDSLRYVIYFLAAINVAGILFLKKIFLQKKSQDHLTTLVAKLRISTIVTFALCEAPAIYGLLLYIIGGSRKDFYALAVYSLLLFAVFFPRLNQWQEYTASATE